MNQKLAKHLRRVAKLEAKKNSDSMKPLYKRMKLEYKKLIK